MKTVQIVAFLAILATVYGSVTMTNIATPSTPIGDFQHHHVGFLTAKYDSLVAESTANPFPFAEFNRMPVFSEGLAGVAAWDYDNDGDVDLYLTNTEGTANSLFQNQFAQTGIVSFIDVASVAHVEATPQTSSGVCYADTDNDGDLDLLVLDNFDNNHIFFENNGDGTFTEKDNSITGIAADTSNYFGTTSCVFGDFNGDGLHDIFFANHFNSSDGMQCFSVDNSGLNSLFIAQGNNVWQEDSLARGVGLDPDISWAALAADMDEDGDLDIVVFNDQCGLPQPFFPRGYLRVLRNDGTAHFTPENNHLGGWMGGDVADLDSDGFLDIFGTNTGQYWANMLPFPTERESTWLKGQGTGPLIRQEPNDTSVFGWGLVAFDIDNDGDTDIYYNGGFNPIRIPIDASNAGAVLLNDGLGTFTRDAFVVDQTVDQVRRQVHGVATADFDNNGFPDIASVAAWKLLPTDGIPYAPLGSAFDTNPEPLFLPQNSQVNGTITFLNITRLLGDFLLEMSSGNNNRWIKVKPIGTVGILSGSQTPRDGIGATFSVSSPGSLTQKLVITGGASHCSQNDLTKNFGLGSKSFARVESFWPGGNTNMLFVSKFRTVHVPEIPCDIKTTTQTFWQFKRCVASSLSTLRQQGIINFFESARLFSGMLIGYHVYH